MRSRRHGTSLQLTTHSLSSRKCLPFASPVLHNQHPRVVARFPTISTSARQSSIHPKPIIAQTKPLRATVYTGIAAPPVNMARFRNVDLMRQADAFPYPGETETPFSTTVDTTRLVTLLHRNADGTDQTIGLLLPQVVEALIEVPEEIRGPVMYDAPARTLRAFEQPTEPERSATVAAVMQRWREQKTFALLSGWRDELWPVYATSDPKAPEVLYSVERAAAGLLGVMRYGVHMTGYVRSSPTTNNDDNNNNNDNDNENLKIWVPRRAVDKSTYPSMLDNTVAGGLMTGEDPFDCMVREADEEASLPEALMREKCKPTGMVTYIYITDERAGGEKGLIYPETQWVYDLELPADVVPTPQDGEVAEFYLWTVPEVQEALARGEFKPNCALILLDFFVRKGILTKENETHYDEIVRRLHREVPFPGPHQAAAA
ncbi:NUDIX domain-containing protein [Apiospora arundinis]|uniref:NUDIX domain-containing protein n=1 Tax=Apiospora arundinis TaxID=335852 RepID=A0ABR2ITB6_9PEZI